MGVNKKSKIDFLTYYQARSTAEGGNQKTTDVIRSHDKDTLNYEEAYDLLELLNQDMVKYYNTLSGTSGDLFQAMLSLLISKDVLTEREFMNTLNALKNKETKGEKFND